MNSSIYDLAFPSSFNGDSFRGLTKREYAAIQLKVPDSGTEWLDVMIRMSLRNDFAAKAMEGMFSSGNLEASVTDENIRDDALSIANEMLKNTIPDQIIDK